MDTLLHLYASLDAVMTRLGLGDFTTPAMILIPVCALAILGGLYSSVAYRALTEDEIEALRHDPDAVELLDQGRVRRW